jgi:hypothetical protein
MMNEETFGELVDQIMAQGYDEETAVRFAVLIGDIPISDEHGNIIVMSGGQELARLKPLKMFE